ncbi:hypothetical protein B296_00031214 [Ensete ventricosum]|uniref:Uncharacterized protein n=1 Tax=Ensete ventricosum TaxID=4639 RepID=A0A427AGW3_ENSVE|nr:hypothetical protein B296_00031214 [Ensete ventricosum]
MKMLNRIATVKDDGTVVVDVPSNLEATSLEVESEDAYGETVDEEPLDSSDLQYRPPMQIVILIVGTRDMVKNKGFLPSAPSEIPIQRKQLKEIIFSLLPACKDPDVDTGIRSEKEEERRGGVATEEDEEAWARMRRWRWKRREVPPWVGGPSALTGFGAMMRDHPPQAPLCRGGVVRYRCRTIHPGCPSVEVESHVAVGPSVSSAPLQRQSHALSPTSEFPHPLSRVKQHAGYRPVQEPGKMTEIIVEALSITKQRGIINKGWGGLGNCKHIMYLPVLPFLLPLLLIPSGIDRRRLKSIIIARQRLAMVEFNRYLSTAVGDDRNRSLLTDFGWCIMVGLEQLLLGLRLLY